MNPKSNACCTKLVGLFFQIDVSTGRAVICINNNYLNASIVIT